MDPVIAYRAYWHAESNSGRIFLKLGSGQTADIPLDSPGELAALCSMLAQNPTATWDAGERLLGTAWLKPGKPGASA